ncbi:hypothetical protein U1Q18_011803 [Sarracenia purpurea var. burkii]
MARQVARQAVSGDDMRQAAAMQDKKLHELIAYVNKCCEEGVAVDIGSVAFITSLNILSNTIFSVNLADLSQDSIKEFKDVVWRIMEEAGKPNLVDYFSMLAKLDPQGIRGRQENNFGMILQLFRQLIDQRLELRKLHNTGIESDMIDIMLNISEENSEEIDRSVIEHLCLDLFVAGTDTTSSTVEWAMAELLRDQDILKKSKDELEKIIGKGKPIQESDVVQLPYLQAVVKETMRMHPPIPFLLPRKVETNVEAWGYTIPQGAQVLVNAWAISHDSGIWLNPTSFMPERFLESDIDVRGQDFELIPFGAGRRICPGLPLVLCVVPAMLGSLINSFDWKLEGEIASKDLDMEEKFGLSLKKVQPLRAVPFHV